MIKPFQIVWELIEFGLQALFLYGLAIILCIGLIAWFIVDSKQEQQQQVKTNVQEMIISDEPKTVIYSKERIEEVKECTRIAGCVIREDGTIEW